MRVVTRVSTRRVHVTPDPIIEFTRSLAPGKRKIVRGDDGLRVVTERVTMWDNVAVERALVSSVTIRGARPAQIMEGAPRTFSQLAGSTASSPSSREASRSARMYSFRAMGSPSPPIPAARSSAIASICAWINMAKRFNSVVNR